MPNNPPQREFFIPWRIDDPIKVSHVNSRQVIFRLAVNLAEQLFERLDRRIPLIHERGPLRQLPRDDVAEPSLLGIGDVARYHAQRPEAFTGHKSQLLVTHSAQGLQ
jgi:hypothetical protein